MNPTSGPGRERQESLALCQHYRIVDDPNGVTSRGRCRHCGATRVFVKTFEDASGEEGGLPDLEEDAGLEVRRLRRGGGAA